MLSTSSITTTVRSESSEDKFQMVSNIFATSLLLSPKKELRREGELTEISLAAE
jgi:hypothetical protein